MRELVIYGMGELGQLYGGAALQAGIRVTPITRRGDPVALLDAVAAETPILIAVGEAALDEVLGALAQPHRDSVILLQNELFPSQWTRHGIRPTVLVPWLLKKPGTPLLVARPTPVFGPHAPLMRELHDVLSIPITELGSEAQLHQALVEKYAFILAINALGLLRDRTLALWLQEDPLRVHALAKEAAGLGAVLCESDVDLDRCERAVEEGMRGFGAMSARGRTAQARVKRALGHAQRLGLELPELARVVAETRS